MQPSREKREETVMALLAQGYAQRWTLDVIAERIVDALDTKEKQWPIEPNTGATL